MPKFRCGKFFWSVILLKNKKCGMVNKSVAWGIGENEGGGKNWDSIVCSELLRIKQRFNSQERKTYCTQAFNSVMESLSSDGIGCFVMWFIRWITWQYALVDCGELVTS